MPALLIFAVIMLFSIFSGCATVPTKTTSVGTKFADIAQLEKQRDYKAATKMRLETMKDVLN